MIPWKSACAAAMAAGLYAATPAVAHEHHDDGPAAKEILGQVSFPTSCTPAAQAGVTHGVALLHSFGYAKAQRQFEAVAKDDPACAIAHWGVAMSLYNQIWDPPNADTLKVGRAEVAKGRAATSAGTTARERAYIDAIGAYYDPADATPQQRAEAYEAKMHALRAAYPDDVEAAAFDALALLSSTPVGDTSLTHERQALAILLPLFAVHPQHPGLAHYITHTCDTPALAQQGLAAAKVYAKIAAASPHALHMPGHIFARLGMWKEDIDSNLASAAASRKAEAAGQPGAAHQMHADEFLIYAWLQTGQVAKAEALTNQMAAIGRRMAALPGNDEMKDEGPFFDAELRAVFGIETHRWDYLVAQQPEPGPADYVFDIYWGQGVGAGHLHDAKRAAAALAAFDNAMAVSRKDHPDAIPAMEIKRNDIAGWLAYAQDRPDDAVAALRAAADQQDKLGQREVDIPAREMLGDLLMLLHRPKEALAEYRVALKLSPNRLNGLRSAAQAAQEAGAVDEAKAYQADAAKQLAIGAKS